MDPEGWDEIEAALERTGSEEGKYYEFLSGVSAIEVRGPDNLPDLVKLDGVRIEPNDEIRPI